MISVIKPTAPCAALGLPPLPKFSVVIATHQEYAILKQVQINRQPFLVEAIRRSIPFFSSDFTVQARVSECIAERNLKPQGMGLQDQPGNIFCEQRLFLAQGHDAKSTVGNSAEMVQAATMDPPAG
jgi:hypothetical protein